MSLLRSAVAAVFVGTLTAQTETLRTNERAWFPPDYRGGLFIDVAGILECGGWDGISRAARSVVHLFFATHFGFEVEHVDVIRAAVGTNLEFSAPENAEIVWVIRGVETEIGFPIYEGPWSFHGTTESERIGGFDVQRSPIWRDRYGEMLYVLPSPGFLVFGPSVYIEHVLKGERKGGAPDTDVLSLSTDRDLLANFVIATELAYLRGPLTALPLDWRDDDDPLTHVALRLRLVDDHVWLECLARFEDGDIGIPKLSAALEDGRRFLLEHRRLGGLRRYWKAVALERDGQDLTATIDLGPPRGAAGHLVSMFGPLWAWVLTTDEVLLSIEPVQLAEPEKRHR